MPGHVKDAPGPSQLDLELYFLIARYLSSGPCQRTAEVLKEELERFQLLPKRIDWEGREHHRSYENLLETNRHISADHLKKICSRIGPVLDKEIKPNVLGVQSLLGAGRQSLLRTTEGTQKVSWPSTTHVVCRHQRPLQPPRNLAHPPHLAHITLAQQFNGVVRSDHAIPDKLYSKCAMHARILGHLSAVYCVAFDRTGQYIFTGADDSLVKIWSAIDGRLLATLRGHSAEITDMAVNCENTLLAAGSCDKTIRVWCLKTTTPVAVLHGHTGMVTSLRFCPLVRGDTRFLASTGGDGCVCFWQYDSSNDTFNPRPIKFLERSRAGAQMLCSSFSPGGIFLATGSSDHVVRVYCFTGEKPEKICELEAHTDRVDSIQYSRRGEHFLTGSKDGTARIWRFERQEWKSLVLNMNSKLPQTNTPVNVSDDNKANKLKVTMVDWNLDDSCIVTAATDMALRVWECNTGKLLHVLKGHEDEVFVLEHNPVDSRIILSAGHDGNIFIWNIETGTLIKSYFNLIEGQGHGAVFDCKWSTDGQQFAATDSHGHILQFGFGSSEKFKKLPGEMFFHTDYRPLIRDANNYVLDEQTQQPPHLMPPPFLVDVDGNPHPPKYQRLVPGREKLKNDQLVPAMGVTPSGDREVLDEPAQQAENQDEDGEAAHAALDAAIQRLQREQEGQPEADRPGPSRRPSRLQEGASPGRSRGPRRTGETEGVRQSHGNVPVSQRATQHDISELSRRIVVRDMDQAVLRTEEEQRKYLAEEEVKQFVNERKKKPLLLDGSESSDSATYIKTRKKKSSGRTAAVRENEETTTNRLTTRALYDTEEEEEEELSNLESDVENDNTVWNSDSSNEGDSSDYSDWAPDAAHNLQPPKRPERVSKRQQKRRKLSSSEPEEEQEHDQEQEEKERPKKKIQPKRKRQQSRLAREQLEIPELPEEFRPPEWLTGTIPRKAPYVPQMGDEVMYFRQGHALYVEAVKRMKIYDIDPNKNQPWHKNTCLREQELVRIVGIKYEIRPPRLCCLKLAYIDVETGKQTGGSFSIKYHDMPDVIDFLVLRQNYNIATGRHWKPTDRFRSMIDDQWWMGTIVSQEPFQAEFTDSMFQCFNVHWDNGETEKMSPWDLEPIDEERHPDSLGGGVAVTQEELKSLMYTPKEPEWPPCGRDQECERISRGLAKIVELPLAKAFAEPVDLNVYPVYGMVIEYPIDISTIKNRAENHYYRRVTSILFDVRYIEHNAEKFNEPNSVIVQQARIITDLCLKFISDPDCDDPEPMYNELIQGEDLTFPDSDATIDVDDEAYYDEPGSSSNKRKRSDSSSPNKRRRLSSQAVSPNAWKDECKTLLDVIFDCDDSVPFRSAVDPIDYPSYYEVIDHPMDLSTVREQLFVGNYDSPLEFAKDMKLIFSNSRQYNTNKRSRIYAMTLRLSAMYDEKIKDTLMRWRHAVRGKGGKQTVKRKVVRKPAKERSRPKPQLRPEAVPSPSKSHDGPSTSVSRTSAQSSTSTAGLSRVTRNMDNKRSGSSRTVTRSRGENSGTLKLTLRPNIKRPKISSSEEEEEEHDDDDDDDDDEWGRRKSQRRNVRSAKKKSLANGHSRYGTRKATGSIKLNKYTELSSPEEEEETEEEEEEEMEEEEQNVTKTKNESESGSETEVSEAKNKSSESSSSSGSSSSSSSSDSDSGSESDSKSSDNSNSENSDSEGSGIVRRSSRVVAKKNIAKSSAIKSRTASKKFDDLYYSTPAENSNRTRTRNKREGDSSGYRTRNRGRQTVRYHEDEDDEDDDFENGSGEYSRHNESVSSRGRVRKLTPRMRASLRS